MKKILFVFLLSIISFANAQNSRLAYDYFRKGDFQKAAALYEDLYTKNTRSRTYFKNLLRCYQELEDYKKGEDILLKQIKKQPNQPYYLVELGYNHQLQHQKEKATALYEKALKQIKKQPSSAYLIGRAFQDNHMLDYALQAYRKALEIKPNLDLDIYIAAIYGEKGEINNMFEAYLDVIAKKPNYLNTIQKYIGKFITDDNQNTNNITFRKTLLKRLQNNPNNSWNKLLSWMYMKQKNYDKALIQEKAIYNRNQKNLNILFDLAKISSEDRDYQTAQNTYSFIIEHAQNPEDHLHAENLLLSVKTAIAKTEADFIAIAKKYQLLLTKYGTGRYTVETQVNYADFLVFKQNKLKEAIAILNQAEKVAISRYERGRIKLKLADIFVFDGLFNKALITYTKVQSDLRSSEIAQTARLKVAKTSYYKGDFDWAKTQLKVLKSATSKLIANNALKLNLLIDDNIAGDTIRLALRKYATADLLAYQNKTKQAIDTLSVVLRDFKGHAIEDEALFKQAELYQKLNQFKQAEHNYQKIIQLKKEGILVDDAYYLLGELYVNKLHDNDKAQAMYQQIIFDYQNSIFLVDARKKFRKLRGDQIDN